MKRLIFWMLAAVSLAALGFMAGSALKARNQEAQIRSLLTESERMSADFQEGLKTHKKKVKKAFQADTVQRFSRPMLRKQFAFDHKDDSQNSSLRIMAASVSYRRSRLRVREVFDSHKPEALWEKVLNMLAREALKRTGEMQAESDDRMKGMLNMLMKGSGLAGLSEPGRFHRLRFLGAPSLFYWNYTTRRCPASVRRDIGAEKCVKGLFLAEIDLHSYARDFFSSRSAMKDGFVRSAVFTDQQNRVLQLFPLSLAHHRELKEAYAAAVAGKTAVLRQSAQNGWILARPASRVEGVMVGLMSAASLVTTTR